MSYREKARNRGERGNGERVTELEIYRKRKIEREGSRERDRQRGEREREIER